MPLLLLVSLYEFRQFLQIVLWIAVPATLVAVFLTIFFHYRRKKRRQGLELAFEEEESWSGKLLQNPVMPSIQPVVDGQADQLPDWLASANPANISLLKKYEQEVRRYRENYALLEQDFRELEGKYTDLRNKAYSADKEADMTLVAQLQQEIKEYKDKISQLQQAANAHPENDEMLQYKAENKELGEQLQQVEVLLQQFQEENNRLQILVTAGNDAAVAGDAGADERIQALQQLLAQTEAERKTLKEKLAEKEYLPDVLEEKKLHINFLQHQLEQRIRNYHTLEQQTGESASQLQQLQNTVAGFDQQIRQLNEELQLRQQQSAEWQIALKNSREEGEQQQEIIRAKTGYIGVLEKNIQDLQEQQEALQTAIVDQQDSMRALQENLSAEQQKAASLENKLELNSQLLVKIYTELARSLNHHGLIITTGQADLSEGNPATKDEILQLEG